MGMLYSAFWNRGISRLSNALLTGRDGVESTLKMVKRAFAESSVMVVVLRPKPLA